MPTPADFTKVFEELKSIFKPYTRKMDRPGRHRYQLLAEHALAHEE